ncbi:hypothetical protein CSC02_0293 [Enterobacter hormaechei subsp. hoffmannii]|nr:hypothetical protein CSC02_0293 [Enterobacter hormaechei subsp. hoffmannii]
MTGSNIRDDQKMGEQKASALNPVNHFLSDDAGNGVLSFA